MSRAVQLLGVLVVGIAIGGALVRVFGSLERSRVEIIHGYTTIVDESGTAIGMAAEPGGQGYLGGYNIAGAWWREGGGPWQRTAPNCLVPRSSGQEVRLGVVQIEERETPGSQIVAWLECLDRRAEALPE